MEAIKSLKESKRTLKSAITKALNDLAVRLAVKEPDCAQISVSLEHIEGKKEEALAIMRDLEIEYEKLKKTAEAEKTSDEADALVDRVDNDTNTARSYLAAQAKIFSSKQKESSEIEGHTNAQQGASDPNKQLERIRIPIFSGNKMEFQQWFAAFSTCVDKTSLAPQFKMLRLEGCLRGEAAETIKGLGYSQTAYDAALSRLQRKYGGDRRKVQAQIEELRKMRPVNEGDPKSMDKFADALERTIVVLKDNSLHADLGGGTLYGIVVEKLPENLLICLFASQGQLEIGYSLVRVRSWVMRFIKNCRVPEEQRIKGEFTTKELSDTELDIIKEAQKEVFNEEIIALTARKELSKRSHLLPLTPMLAGGLLRSNTRLRRSDDLAADTKFPIILPKKHHVTQLIVKYHHEMESHKMGVNYTLNHLRARYHVIHSRQEVKACIHNCFECKRRFRLHPAKQQMAPFTNCATDYGGPYLTMQGRGRARTKRFLCLFVCLQTRCCHLEMATSLDTGSFMNAFTRMTARRGWPKIMVSDNGSNFLAADREIRELVAELDQEQIRRTTANKGVEWYWNPPAAPHFGGVFEALIKAAKRAISAILQDADVTNEELQTCFTGVESLLNSRPLTTISDDPNDEPVLTPNHFIIGQMGGDIVPDSVDTTEFNPRQRWR